MNQTMTTDHDNHGGGGGERDPHVGHDVSHGGVTARPSTRATEGRNRAITLAALATADTPVMRITSGCSVGGSGEACCSPFPSC